MPLLKDFFVVLFGLLCILVGVLETSDDLLFFRILGGVVAMIGMGIALFGIFAAANPTGWLELI
jgi:hypothetical protein